MASKQIKALEKKVGDYMTKCVYSALKDVETSTDRESPFADEVRDDVTVKYQTYDNLCKAKDDETRFEAKAKPFTFSTEAKQHSVALLLKMIECGECEIKEDQTIEDIIDSLEEGYSANIFTVGVKTPCDMGPTLTDCSDDTNYIHQQIVGLLPMYKNDLHVIATITEALMRTYKVLAWNLAMGIWYGTVRAVNNKVYTALLASCGIPLEYCNELYDNVRVVVRKAKVVADDGDAADADDADGDGADAAKVKPKAGKKAKAGKPDDK
jgi:hypothetical protein